MKLYIITSQTEDNISAYMAFTNYNKAKKKYDELEKKANEIRKEVDDYVAYYYLNSVEVNKVK